MPLKPTYTLHPSFPVRRVLWRPGYECELALVSNTEFGTKANHDLSQGLIVGSASSGTLTRVGSAFALDSLGFANTGRQPSDGIGTRLAGGVVADISAPPNSGAGDAVEIWDVRRGWVAKWAVPGSSGEGGVTGKSTHQHSWLSIRRLTLSS